MLNKLMGRFRRFMYGRYGVDKFGIHMLWACVAVNVISMFLPRSISMYVMLVVDVVLLYQLYRTFSKNIVKRSIENTRYLTFLTRVRRTFKVIKLNLSDRQYHYFLCPECAQMVRVPRGRGKVEIQCPNCRKSFERKA